MATSLSNDIQTTIIAHQQSPQAIKTSNKQHQQSSSFSMLNGDVLILHGDSSQLASDQQTASRDDRSSDFASAQKHFQSSSSAGNINEQQSVEVGGRREGFESGKKWERGCTCGEAIINTTQGSTGKEGGYCCCSNCDEDGNNSTQKQRGKGGVGGGGGGGSWANLNNNNKKNSDHANKQELLHHQVVSSDDDHLVQESARKSGNNGKGSKQQSTTASGGKNQANSPSPNKGVSGGTQQAIKNNQATSAQGKNRGETNSSSSAKKSKGRSSPIRSSTSPYRYQPSSTSGNSTTGASSLIQSAGLAYPFLYPNTYHLAAAAGFPASPAGPHHQYSSYTSTSERQSQSGSTSSASTANTTSTGANASRESVSGTGSGTGGNSSSGNSRRGGKKKAPAAQTQNPEFRLFFNLKRRDSATQSNKGGQAHHNHHIYKPKNPLTLQEWFKKLSIEERVNSLSTVCPHLTDTFVNMCQKMDQTSSYGQYSSFARIGPHNQEHKYYGSSGSGAGGYLGYPSSHQSYSPFFQDHHPYSVSSQNSSLSSSMYSISFDDLFYHRQSSSEYEQLLLNNTRNSSDRNKLEAEQEILKHIRLTDYYQLLDTLTVNEELVQDPDYFFKLMSLATCNMAFSSPCHFEIRPTSSYYAQAQSASSHHSSYHNQYMQGYPQPAPTISPSQLSLVVDQPAWFKPKSFHSFATWVIVALEENLWAHYNYESGQNLSAGIKINDLQQSLFRERADTGALDLDLEQLAQYWKERNERERRAIFDNLRSQVVKEWESENTIQAGGSAIASSNSQSRSKIVQTKNLSYSLQIKERQPMTSTSTSTQINNQNAIQEQVDMEMRCIFELGMRTGFESELVKSLIYTGFDRQQLKIYPIQRKLLDLIKKKYKDDLMENLLQEEYFSSTGGGNNKANNSSHNSASMISSGQNSANNLASSKAFKKKKKKTSKVVDSGNQLSTSNTNAPTQANTSSSSADHSLVLDNTVGVIDDVSQQSNTAKKKKSKSSNPLTSSLSTTQPTSGAPPTIQQQSKATEQQITKNTTTNSNSTSIESTAKKVQAQQQQQSKKNKKSNNNNAVTNTGNLENAGGNRKITTNNEEIKIGSRSEETKNNKAQIEVLDQQWGFLNFQYSSSAEITKDCSTLNKMEESITNQQAVILDLEQADVQKDTSKLDQAQAPDNDSVIRTYLRELTHQMITEVCRRVMVASEATIKDDTDSAKSQDLPQIESKHQESSPLEEVKLNNQEMKDSDSLAKGSSSGNSAPARKGFGILLKPSQGNNEEQVGTTVQRPISRRDSQHSTSSKQAVVLSTDAQQAWAKGTARLNESTPNPTTNTKKKQGHATLPNQQKTLKHHEDNSKTASTSKKSDPQSLSVAPQVIKQQQLSSSATTTKPLVSSLDQQLAADQAAKKKRNKKKQKLTDTDIMNNFMKSLHSHQDDEPTALSTSKHANLSKQTSTLSSTADSQNRGKRQTTNNNSNHDTEGVVKKRGQLGKTGAATAAGNGGIGGSNTVVGKKFNEDSEIKSAGDGTKIQTQTTQAKNGKDNNVNQDQVQVVELLLESVEEGLKEKEHETITESEAVEESKIMQGSEIEKNIEGCQDSEMTNVEIVIDTIEVVPEKTIAISKIMEEPVQQEIRNQDQMDTPTKQSMTLTSQAFTKNTISVQQSTNEAVAKNPNFQNFQPFIPSQISTTNSHGDLQSIEIDQEMNSQTKQYLNDEGEIDAGKEETKINTNYRTPPQSSKKQGTNQLSQQNFGGNLHHFTSTEVPNNIQSYSAASGNSNNLSNHYKRLQSFQSNNQTAQQQAISNQGFDQQPFYPSIGNQELSSSIQSTFGGLQQHQFYGNFQSFGQAEINSTSQSQPSQSYQPVIPVPSIMTPPPSMLNTTGSIQTPSNQVFYPSSSKSPNLQSSLQHLFTPSTNQYQPTMATLPQLNHSHSTQISGQNSHQSKRHFGNAGSLTGGQNKHYQRPHAQRGIPGGRGHGHIHNNATGGSGGSGVQVQLMNLSQSMQEQMLQQNQFNYQHFQPNMVDSQNIFYQDQSAINDIISQQKFNDPSVFPYMMERSQSVNVHNPLPSYSPTQQYPLSHFQSINNEVLPDHFNQQQNVFNNMPGNYRPTNVHHQQHYPQAYDHNQDLIFQIVNSIKSNHSMSPVPQQVMSPTIPHSGHDQMSHHSSEHLSSNGGAGDHLTHHAYHSPDPQNLFFEHFDMEIQTYVTQIQENLNLLKPERDFVLIRLQEIATRAFLHESPKIELFGSLITGLALESSDMDIAVTGLRIDDRIMMIEDLQKLSQALQLEWKSIESFKAIETASIPVIKMKVDLVRLRQGEMPEREEGDFARRIIPENQRYLSVDITFDDSSNGGLSQHQLYLNPYMMLGDQSDLSQTKTHLGLASCRLVQWYTQNYRNLKQVAILMKKFLALHNFNSPYYGGLSSYSTVILIVAFINYFGLRDGIGGSYCNPQGTLQLHQEDMTPARLLVAFLDFYSYTFNPNLTGISVVGNGSFFQLNCSSTGSLMSPFLQSPADLLLSTVGPVNTLGSSGMLGIATTTSNLMILDPLNTVNNTTKNSYLTKEILQQFSTALSNLRSLIGKTSSQSSTLSQASQSSTSAQAAVQALHSPLSVFLSVDGEPVCPLVQLNSTTPSPFLPHSQLDQDTPCQSSSSNSNNSLAKQQHQQQQYQVINESVSSSSSSLQQETVKMVIKGVITEQEEESKSNFQGSSQVKQQSLVFNEERGNSDEGIRKAAQERNHNNNSKGNAINRSLEGLPLVVESQLKNIANNLSPKKQQLQQERGVAMAEQLDGFSRK